MALRIRFQYPTFSTLGYSVERLADGWLYDFLAGVFVAKPDSVDSIIKALPEDVAPFLGRFRTTLSPTPADQFADGDYCVSIHDAGRAEEVVAELAITMHDGDDATVFPAATFSLNLPGFGVNGTLGPAMNAKPGP